MTDLRIRRIVIVGGGTAGWMTAAALARLLRDDDIHIRLIESDAIATIGVGEATIPHILYFNRLLGLDESEFMRKTQATFKAGIEFVDWGRKGQSYIHPFGPYGVNMEGLHFHHFWLRYARMGKAAPLERYNLVLQAARAGKFQKPDPAQSGLPAGAFSYAFQFDAGLYAAYLRQIAEANGVRRTEGRIVKVDRHGETGHVDSLTLEGGETVPGELFIDCSGFRGLLIEQTLQSGFEDWSAYLPCDRAVARGCERVGPVAPYTRAVADAAGWRWRIPLQSRTGNGHVYCSEFMRDEAALDSLNGGLDGAPVSEPNFLKFRAGVRRTSWNRNVVAIGLSSGFLEPLESTSIHMVQSAIARLMANFPDKTFNQPDIDFYNRRTRLEYEQVRDFIVLHYHATERDDSPFWRYCRNMEIPQSLTERIRIYKENGRLYRLDNELFNEVSWLAVLHGQNIAPERYHPLADILPAAELENRMRRLEGQVRTALDLMPPHDDFLHRYLR